MSIEKAKEDFKYLINRGYKKDVALNFVANHYKLSKEDRLKIIRTTHSDKEIKLTKRKLKKLKDFKGKTIYIDGFNVLISLEALIKGNKIVLCDDNIYRDFENVYGKYKINEYSDKAISLLLEILKHYNIKAVIYLDAQVSKSGILAKKIREKMKAFSIEGEVFCVKNCDYELKNKEVVATSDSVIIKSENVKYVVDLIAEAIEYLKKK
ncbi:TPA: DUF434 domain-containing protein [Methanocaldococcus jannaschii]|uniref:Uncharacterized protein MJ0935 n=2 Tax=Methanocaldococcus jannaschii TaxID=2190 RepID=Y935_METJA|nr:DUF434 domain-containing protein [Methanocaldococcus jannaschii]Q58345.1 RecName: Full=Uncharacterized protein MJ0935 [Methanocaldococcus jannaschii DSM 2661]AAB98940.1 conserved hypothetical protein [Methanocaldococcus jannaschii DSM 2661]HII59816.1 DUF434 domain-containing protein [Methanocaldococcus jannaschii]